MTKRAITITWTNPLTEKTVEIRVTHEKDYLIPGTDHIEIESIKPKRAPLPISETGYRSHFCLPEEITRAGGLQPFVQAWINRAAQDKAWIKNFNRSAQGDLFQWAATKATKKKPYTPVAKKQAPKRPKPKPKKKPGRKPAPR